MFYNSRIEHWEQSTSPVVSVLLQRCKPGCIMVPAAAVYTSCSLLVLQACYMKSINSCSSPLFCILLYLSLRSTFERPGKSLYAFLILLQFPTPYFLTALHKAKASARLQALLLVECKVEALSRSYDPLNSRVLGRCRGVCRRGSLKPAKGKGWYLVTRLVRPVTSDTPGVSSDTHGVLSDKWHTQFVKSSSQCYLCKSVH